jgi:hypothetical protein
MHRTVPALVGALLSSSSLLAQEIDVPDLDLPEIDTSGLDVPADDAPVPAPDAAPADAAPADAAPTEEPVPGRTGDTEATPLVVDDPAKGWSAYTEGLTWSPVLEPLNLQVLPTSQAWFDSYVPFFGDEGGAGGLWLGYQGTGVAGLMTMGATAATNALFEFPSDKDLSLAFAAGGFNDRAPLAVGAGLLGLYGRVGGVSLAVGGSGALESVPVFAADGSLSPFAFGAGYGAAAELGIALWDDGHLVARTSVSQIAAFDTFDTKLTKIDPTVGLMVQLFGTPLVVAVGASIVAPDGREPIIAPRIFLGGGFDDEPKHADDGTPGGPVEPAPDAPVEPVEPGDGGDAIDGGARTPVN